MRILTLGLNNAGKSALINRLKHNDTKETQPTKGFNVTAIDFNSNRFTLWEVGGDENNRSSFKQHVQNTHGIIFVVDASEANTYDDAREQLQLALKEDSLAGLPLLVFANKIDQGGNLQDVIEKLTLNQVNDREWYIQGSEALSGLGVNQGFDWITKLILTKGNKSFSFDAQPKVVKSQAKYKQHEPEPTSKSQMTFVNLMKDQKVIMMNPVQQENEYIKLEKERIKIENMHSQLKNFKKNKNKMTPYEIKPSPNPRIDVNLDFFLTDHNNLIEAQKTDCVIQTDEFVERPPTPPYVPKKTGIDAETQVEDFELFNFDREVTPIVNVIVTKTCEQSMLEIEQEEEIKKMKTYKREYYERRESNKEKQQMTLNKEIDQIKLKNDKLNKYLDKEDRIITSIQRAQSFGIAGQYLRDLKKNTFETIYNSGFYPNTLENKLKSQFIPWLVEETVKNIEIKKNLSKQIVGLFDSDCIPPLLSVKEPWIAERKKKQARINQRRVNESNKIKYVRIAYKESKFTQSNFVRDFARFNDGSLEEYNKSYAAKVEDLKSKIESGEIQEEDYQKLLFEEFPEQTGWGFQVEKVKKLAFTLAHNRYYKTQDSQKKLSLVAKCMASNADTLYSIDKENLQRPNTQDPKINKFIRYKTNIRDPRRKIDNDEAIIIDFDKIPEEVNVIFIFTRIHNIVSWAAQQAEIIPYAQAGVEDWKQNIAIDDYQVTDQVKLEEIVKSQDENQEEQSAFIFSYVLTRKGTNWIIEQIKNVKAFYELPKNAESDALQEEGEEGVVAAEQQQQQQQNNNEQQQQNQNQNENDENNNNNQQNSQQQNNNNNEKKVPQSEFDEYVSNIKEFWGYQDGTNKRIKNDSSIMEGEDGQQENNENDGQQGGESIENNSQMVILSQPRVTDKFEISLENEFEQIQNLLEQQIEALDPEFISLCTNGFDFFFHDKPLERMGQVRRIRNVLDLEVRVRPPPPPEPEEKEEGEEGEEGEGEEGEEDQDQEE